MSQPPTAVPPRYHADTLLAEIPSLPAAARAKLQQLGATTLEELVARLSRAQLKRTRGIGPKTLVLLERLLAEVGLQLADNRIGASARVQEQIQQFNDDSEQLKQRVAAWVSQHRPEADEAWRAHRPGAYGDYLQAQLLALNDISADPVVKREFEHQLVRSLHRYRRQGRYAQSKEALMDAITAQGRVDRSRRR